MTLVAVISSGRPGAPRSMAPFLGQRPALWMVGRGEADDYEQFGRPQDTFYAAGGLIEARNRALDEAFSTGQSCLQLSDDLRKLERLQAAGGTMPVFLDAVMGDMDRALDATGAMLAGVAPTANALWGSMNTKQQAFCVGDMILVRPSEPRFDPALRLKEDYDFTAQHLAQYGKVARCDWILATFAHGTNRGGAVAYRTPDVEAEAIEYLRSKWGEVIADNPKRPDEVLFKWGNYVEPVHVKPVREIEQDGFGL